MATLPTDKQTNVQSVSVLKRLLTYYLNKFQKQRKVLDEETKNLEAEIADLKQDEADQIKRNINLLE